MARKRKRNTNETIFNFQLLPIDIITEILHKLPFTDKFKMRTVCRQFNVALTTRHEKASDFFIGDFMEDHSNWIIQTQFPMESSRKKFLLKWDHLITNHAHSLRKKDGIFKHFNKSIVSLGDTLLKHVDDNINLIERDKGLKHNGFILFLNMKSQLEDLITKKKYILDIMNLCPIVISARVYGGFTSGNKTQSFWTQMGHFNLESWSEAVTINALHEIKKEGKSIWYVEVFAYHHSHARYYNRDPFGHKVCSGIDDPTMIFHCFFY
jgi:hypothetical protein